MVILLCFAAEFIYYRLKFGKPVPTLHGNEGP